MKSLCAYCENKNKCSSEEKRNCELCEDCDEFERKKIKKDLKKR